MHACKLAGHPGHPGQTFAGSVCVLTSRWATRARPCALEQLRTSASPLACPPVGRACPASPGGGPASARRCPNRWPETNYKAITITYCHLGPTLALVGSLGVVSCRYRLSRKGPGEVKGTPRPRRCSVAPRQGKGLLVDLPSVSNPCPLPLSKTAAKAFPKSEPGRQRIALAIGAPGTRRQTTQRKRIWTTAAQAEPTNTRQGRTYALDCRSPGAFASNNFTLMWPLVLISDASNRNIDDLKWMAPTTWRQLPCSRRLRSRDKKIKRENPTRAKIASRLSYLRRPSFEI
jgi:hypothetical protein